MVYLPCINFAGREYETRNYSFEEVNHYMAEQLATVGYCTYFSVFEIIVLCVILHLGLILHVQAMGQTQGRALYTLLLLLSPFLIYEFFYNLSSSSLCS